MRICPLTQLAAGEQRNSAALAISCGWPRRLIGVRDETRLVGGYAQCGQELCCTRFGGQFEPVSIRMAKEQDLPLNSSKISGVCGRLMCCLRYEFEAYKDFKSRAPKKKTLIDTPLGKARIQEYDTPREQLVLRLENGKVFKVNLADMTCSEGCKKKAAEQGCNCRPDCVTREKRGIEPLCAVWRRQACAPVARELLDQDRQRIRCLIDRVHAGYLDEPQIVEVAGSTLCFENVNTPEEFAAAELLA